MVKIIFDVNRRFGIQAIPAYVAPFESIQLDWLDTAFRASAFLDYVAVDMFSAVSII